MLVPIALTTLSLAAQDAPDPHRQFDFWVGEWSVQNRHIQPDKSWKEGTVTRARIVPVCGGKAVLEEWAGPLHGNFMNGFSLRAYDPARKDWNLLLFWTVDGNGGFGTLRGAFRHGRGEFFNSWKDASGADVIQRYSFSDALPETVRWDSAMSHDGGDTWRTDWIMEFSRTRPAGEVTQDVLFAEPWTEGSVSPHPEARRLDWLLGEWRGHQTDARTGVEREARLRCKLLNKDCLVLDLLETRAEGSEDWDERLCVRGLAARRGAWESWRIDEDDTVLRQSVGRFDGEVAIFEREGARETIVRVEDGRVVIEEEEDGELARVTKLERG